MILNKKEQPFIDANGVLINLRNVSNINILEEENRIVFNLNYTIDITRGSHKKNISDYVYWDSREENDLYRNIRVLLENPFMIENFILVKGLNNTTFVNTNEISTVKFMEHQSRIIFNMSHPISFKGKNLDYNLTSEFVYINCSSDTYTEISDHVKEQLGLTSDTE